jgi:hypothetical protein
MQKFFILGLAATVLVSFSACEANLNANVGPSPAVSASPSADPSSAPSTTPDTTAGATVGANVGVNVPGVSVGGNTSGSVSTPAPSANGALTVSGADVFNAYNVSYSKGMKWVYGMKNDIGSVSVPNLPAGFELPGGVGGSMDLGTFSMEVIDIQGDLVTFRTEINNALPGAPAVPPSETTVKKEAASALYVEAFQSAGSGTLSWSRSGTKENVSVPAGSYNAGVVTGKANIIVDGTTGALNQDIKVWVMDAIGMVKEEVVSKTSTNGVMVDTTTIIELKSFTK